MTPTIHLNTEIRDNYMFIYGTWWLGELKITFDELHKFITEENYTQQKLSKPKQCRSCHQEETNTIFILHLDDESLPLCPECKVELQKTIDKSSRDNSTQISSNLL